MKAESPFETKGEIIRSTLEGIEICNSMSPYRQSGNSTRQIDLAIQIIFRGNVCVVQDHWEGGEHRDANKNLFNRILKRIGQEHERDAHKIRFCKYKLLIKMI